jgi:hypothetical protein
MKSLSVNSRKIENLVYFLIWALVFSVPYFSQRDDNVVDWKKVIVECLHLLGYLAVFLLNVYVLVPKLLLEKKYTKYFGFTFGLISLIIMINLFVQIGPKPQDQPVLNRPSNEIKPQPLQQDHGFEPRRQPKPPLMVFVDNFIICILITGAGTATKLVTKWLDEEKLRMDIEKEQLQTNLTLLRNQVSPHFFMNTLNNIHTLVDINTESAKDALVRLSTLMRYFLYDSARGQIELRKEVEFIKSFISLMELRFSDEVDVQLVIPNNIPEVRIPPMLFISFLENAFKHGVRYPLKSFIYFEMQVNGSNLQCTVKNSRHPIIEVPHGEYSGLGLKNIKKSLHLLYGNTYKLDIAENEKTYEVHLTIPLS